VGEESLQCVQIVIKDSCESHKGVTGQAMVMEAGAREPGKVKKETAVGGGQKGHLMRQGK